MLIDRIKIITYFLLFAIIFSSCDYKNNKNIKLEHVYYNYETVEQVQIKFIAEKMYFDSIFFESTDNERNEDFVFNILSRYKKNKDSCISILESKISNDKYSDKIIIFINSVYNLSLSTYNDYLINCDSSLLDKYNLEYVDLYWDALNYRDNYIIENDLLYYMAEDSVWGNPNL